jgi:hypothetical protein
LGTLTELAMQDGGQNLKILNEKVELFFLAKVQLNFSKIQTDFDLERLKPKGYSQKY